MFDSKKFVLQNFEILELLPENSKLLSSSKKGTYVAPL